MKTRRLVFYSVLILLFNLILIQAIAMMWPQQEMTADQKKMMEQMMKYATPGKEHEFLEKYVGDWDVTISNWQSAMSKPTVSKGTIKNQLLFDGRYLMGKFEGAMGGMMSQGLEIIGYDLLNKKFNTFWIDNMGTGFLVTSGTLDASGKVLTETAQYPDPMTDGKTIQKLRNVTTFMDDGSYKFEMYMIMPDGKDMKSMELVCKRK
ncbi:MAG TPA: DUF1579 domain-containing protein [Acidobacteriota bacterium]|nr:DUF1579 domain-containing protein [Acidobacteriota bacterium]